jgi:hypothetical protein
MTVKSEVKGTWRDAKKFAKKHPFTALLIGGLAAYSAANMYFTAYVGTRLFEGAWR